MSLLAISKTKKEQNEHSINNLWNDIKAQNKKTQNGKEVTYYQNRNYIHSNENQNRSSKLWMKHNPVDLT